MRWLILGWVAACGGSHAGTDHDAAVVDASADAAIVQQCGSPKPGPTNTGPRSGIVLAPSGSITANVEGQVIENLDIAGEVMVLANNVTIRNVRITSGDYYPIRYFDNNNTGLVVEDSEIHATSGDATSAIAFANYTARRLNVHGSADGFKADENVLIEDSWIHDLSNGPTEHNDGVQSTGGKNVTLRHNTISGASNACVQTGDEGGVPTENLVIDCNWLDGGGYTLNIRGTPPTEPRGTRVTDNRFGTSAYGPWTFDDPSPVVTGNVDDATGAPIPYP